MMLDAISPDALSVIPVVAWVALPFLAGFSMYLVPQLARYLALIVCAVSAAYALPQMLTQQSVALTLLDNFGVTLLIDNLSGYFIVMNALVTAAVLLYCWRSDRSAFFFTQVTVLHGSVNAAFICADFISLYVALEVIGVAAFLLIAYPRTNRSIWVALRYLFVSNTAMLFYLIGAVLVYQAHGSFAFVGLEDAPPEAIALIVLGLLTKGGIFVSGLWLPLTHAESETPVSALLSGVVVKAGVFPLVRCALLVESLDPVVRFFGVGTALLGVGYAIFAKDAKRMLAFHTISQLGFMLAAPVVSGFYALTHGLVKAALFLGTGNLPSRKFKVLKQTAIATPLWVALAIASASISGLPLLAGFGSKTLTVKNLLPWQGMALNVAAVGTAISFAKFIFLPHGRQLDADHAKADHAESIAPQSKPLTAGFWAAMVLLLGGLMLGNGLYPEAYTLGNIGKACITVAVGWTAYLLIFRRSTVVLPRAAEQFEHLIGAMSLVLTLLFWMVLT